MAGCWPFDPPTKPGKEQPTPELLDRTSPQNVLYNFRVIYGDKDNIVNTNEDAHTWAESYRTLFHPDSFKFHFLPGDFNAQLWPEGWWGTNDEVASLEGMLRRKAAGEITDIQLSWTVNASERVPSGTADFYFSPDPADSSLWVITEWQDIQPGGTTSFQSAEPPENYANWGRIKTLYYH
jgi:hypothetical protein